MKSQKQFLVSKVKYYPLKRSIIKFDLSSIPSNAQIQSADFSAYYYGYGGSGTYWVTRFVEAHRLTRDWEEMEADRDGAENGVNWTGQLAEGDYDDDAGDPGVLIDDKTDYGWKEFDIEDIVEDWVDGTEPNYGLLLRTLSEGDGCDLRFRSSEYGTTSYRPKLEITYKREFYKNYYLKDHLGNIRVTIDEDGDVVGYNDYYPFGLQMPGRSMNNALTDDIYKFSGKELDEENNLDWYYFGARYYDPAIGRWLSVDPLAHKRPGLTPYNYARNNPLVFIDPTGLVDIYLWFNNSSLTQDQQKIVSSNIATSFTNAGVKDVNVETAGWFHRNIIGGGVGDNIDIKFNNEGDPQKGAAGGRAALGSGKADVYEQALPNDDPNTPVDEKATAASNVGTHEAGHASEAKLKHSNPPDGSIMDAKVKQSDVGTKRRDFNKKHSEELQKAYNEEDKDK